jgi:hypothetical protein
MRRVVLVQAATSPLRDSVVSAAASRRFQSLRFDWVTGSDSL